MDTNKVYDILNSFKSKKEAYDYFKITPNSYGIKKLNDIANNAGFNLNLYKERRRKKYGECLHCGKKLEKFQTIFCSYSCSAKYNNIGRNVSEQTKEKIRNKLLKTNKVKKCSKCGQEQCNNLEICKHTIKWFKGLEFLDFDINKIGSIDIYSEYYRIKELLEYEYLENNLSPTDIAIKYKYDKKSENILHILKTFNIKTRNISESVINACIQGKLNNIIKTEITDYQFKHGWYTTWNNKSFYYRSSYELEYAKQLDKNKIDYDVEYFRIKYWDSLKCKYRVAIPDFYIKNENKIIEIKSRVTFNKQNIIDKFNEYLKLGFNVLLILDDKEYKYNEINNLVEYKFIF